MPTYIKQVIGQAVETVEREVEDPNTYRANDGKRWVYDHFPKYGKNAELPRIGFSKVTNDNAPQGISKGVSSQDIADVQASILVRKNKSYDIDDDGTPEPAETVIDYLSKKVRKVIENNQSDFTSIGDDVIHVKPLNSSTTRPEGKNAILEAVTFEVRIFS